MHFKFVLVTAVMVMRMTTTAATAFVTVMMSTAVTVISCPPFLLGGVTIRQDWDTEKGFVITDG